MKKIFLILALLASNGAFATGYADAAKCASKTVFKGMSKACSKEGATLMAVVATGVVVTFGTVYAYGRLTGSNHKQTIKSMGEGLAMLEEDGSL